MAGTSGEGFDGVGVLDEDGGGLEELAVGVTGAELSAAGSAGAAVGGGTGADLGSGGGLWPFSWPSEL